MSWVPQPDGSLLCPEHDERFRAPAACSKCGPQNAAIEVVDHESEILDERARMMGLGDELDDERVADSMRRRFWAWAKAARGGSALKRGDDGEIESAHADPNHRAAADYGALALRALRTKAELTIRRRDWRRYYLAARDALRLKNGSPESRLLRDAIKDAADGREVSN